MVDIISNHTQAYFTLAERASPDDVVSQYQHYADLMFVQQMIDALPDPFLVLNQQRQAVLMNQAMLNLVGGESLADVIGMRVGELLRCTNAFREGDGCGVSEHCRQCGALHAMLTSLAGKTAISECRITQDTGDALDVRVWTTPLMVDGEPYSMIAVKDIADEKRRRFLERIFFS